MIALLVLIALLELVALASVPHILLSGKRPVSMIIWIGVVLLLPGLGLSLYLVIGNDRVRRRRFDRRGHSHSGWDEVHSDDERLADLAEEDRRLLTTVSRICRHPVTRMRFAGSYFTGKTYYPDLVQSLDSAKDVIWVEMYWWRNDDTGRRVLDSLTNAAKRGVSVRLLVDEIGSFEVGKSFFQPLIDAGGAFSWFYTFHPRRNRFFFNLRNHRKFFLIDRRLAYIGGINIGKEYEGLDPEMGDWKDLQIRFEGEGIRPLEEVFRHDWFFSTEEKLHVGDRERATPNGSGCPAVVVESGPDTRRGIALNAFLAMIGRASRRLDLFTPYFIPEPQLVSAVQVAVASGVEVRIMVSKKNDYQALVDIGRSFYEELLSAGVHIYEYDRSMHHAKLGIVDDAWVLAGSANLDARSMNLNFEVGVLFRSEEACRQLDAHFDKMFSDAIRIDPERFAKRTTYQRLKQGALRLWAPLL